MSKNYPQFKLKLVRIFRTMLKLAKRCRWAAIRLLPVQQESQTCQNGNGSRQLQLPDVEDEGVANLHGCGQSASGGLAKSWQMNIHDIESYGSKPCRLLLLKGIPSEAWNILNPAWTLFLLDSKNTRQEAEKVKRWEKNMCLFICAAKVLLTPMHAVSPAHINNTWRSMTITFCVLLLTWMGYQVSQLRH